MMTFKRLPFMLLASATFLAATVSGAASAGVSIQVGQPGFYGRIDLGSNTPPPVLIYPQPMVITQAPIGLPRQPIYLHVPPGHAKNWGKHCSRYNACGQPVYFVQDNWYNQQYAPQFRGQGEHDRDERREHGDRGDNDHGRGQGRGNGHGNGRGRD